MRIHFRRRRIPRSVDSVRRRVGDGRCKGLEARQDNGRVLGRSPFRRGPAVETGQEDSLDRVAAASSGRCSPLADFVLAPRAVSRQLRCPGEHLHRRPRRRVADCRLLRHHRSVIGPRTDEPRALPEAELEVEGVPRPEREPPSGRLLVGEPPRNARGLARALHHHVAAAALPPAERRPHPGGAVKPGQGPAQAPVEAVRELHLERQQHPQPVPALLGQGRPSRHAANTAEGLKGRLRAPRPLWDPDEEAVAGLAAAGPRAAELAVADPPAGAKLPSARGPISECEGASRWRRLLLGPQPGGRSGGDKVAPPNRDERIEHRCDRLSRRSAGAREHGRIRAWRIGREPELAPGTEVKGGDADVLQRLRCWSEGDPPIRGGGVLDVHAESRAEDAEPPTGGVQGEAVRDLRGSAARRPD
mmetsp:Transcript_2311/g.5471  ORF Transcript_2311/g.5471 Transcript_2311/m.5471 type:complete len:417 (-) Transcript_2311:107-1357(-)